MRERFERLGKAVWCHRAAYAGLALAYGAKCLGVIDADMLAQIVTALYCAMVGQRHQETVARCNVQKCSDAARLCVLSDILHMGIWSSME